MRNIDRRIGLLAGDSWVAEAVIALFAVSDGFSASDLAARGQQTLAQYDPPRAAYDPKKLRGRRSCSVSARHVAMRPGRQASRR
jgi:hypothetical protein